MTAQTDKIVSHFIEQHADHFAQTMGASNVLCYDENNKRFVVYDESPDASAINPAKEWFVNNRLWFFRDLQTGLFEQYISWLSDHAPELRAQDQVFVYLN